MKKKFLVGIIVLIVLFSVTNVYAVTYRNTNTITESNNTVQNNTENSVRNRASNTSNELSDDDLIPALEKELQEKQSSENSNTENTTNRNVTNTTSNTTSNSTVSNSSEISNQDKEILSDVYIVSQIESNIVYEDFYIDGNVYIVDSSQVEFKNCEIDGNIFAISESLKLTKTKVEGSIYGIIDEMICSESQVKSLYIAGDTLEIDEASEIVNDVRAIANNINILGEVGRDLYTQAFETSNVEYSVTIQDILPELFAKFVIILVISFIILSGFPKFSKVNVSLKIRSFFKAFFTGIIEIIVITLIALLLMALGLGIGYAFAILMLLFAILCLGKILFIVAFALRLVKNKARNVRTKAFIFTIFVAAVVEAIELLAVLGETGFIVSLVIDIVLSITGFGSLMRVIFTSNPKKAKDEEKQEMPVTEPPKLETKPVQENITKPATPVKENIVEHDLKLELENIDSENSKPEVYEVTGKIVKRKISPDDSENKTNPTEEIKEDKTENNQEERKNENKEDKE